MLVFFKDVLDYLHLVRVDTIHIFIPTVHWNHIQYSNLFLQILICSIDEADGFKKIEPFLHLINFLWPLNIFNGYSRINRNKFRRGSDVVALELDESVGRPVRMNKYWIFLRSSENITNKLNVFFRVCSFNLRAPQIKIQVVFLYMKMLIQWVEVLGSLFTIAPVSSNQMYHQLKNFHQNLVQIVTCNLLSDIFVNAEGFKVHVVWLFILILCLTRFEWLLKHRWRCSFVVHDV